MKPSVRLAGVAAVAACGIALVAWRMQEPTHPVAETSSPASARHAPAPAAAPMAGTPVPSPAPLALDLPAVELPPDTWLPGNDLRDFEAAAAAGDVEAMLRVGRALRACVEPLADPRGVEMREAYEREITGLRARKVPGEGDGAWPWKNVHGRYALRAAVHADCLAIGAGRVATGLGWIERAARAGNTPAKVEYARDAFSEFENGKALLAHLDEVARRRDLARAWVMQALEAGEAGAVDVLVDAYYGESPLFPRNYQQGAPYSMAQEMIRTRRVDAAGFRRLYEQGPVRDSYAWGEENAWVRDDAAWQAALDRARQIVDRIPPDPPRAASVPPG